MKTSNLSKSLMILALAVVSWTPMFLVFWKVL